jgi:hypothetical protein
MEQKSGRLWKGPRRAMRAQGQEGISIVRNGNSQFEEESGSWTIGSEKPEKVES